MHNLKLLVRDSELDANYLIITDISEYDDALPVNNNAMFIQPPGFVDAIEVLFSKGQTTAYNTKTLGLTTGKSIGVLPDMLYTITYSVAPNDTIYTLVYHFRTAYLESILYRGIADLKTGQDVHETDSHGINMYTKLHTTYLTCLLMLEGIKGNMKLDQDLTKATAMYHEVERLLSTVKTGY